MSLVKKIDFHAHAFRKTGPVRANKTNWLTVSELCEMHDAMGIEKAVLLPLIAPESCAYSISTNEDVYDMVMQNPARFCWFCNVDPRCNNGGKDADFEHILKHYKDLGAKGVGEITSNVFFDDPRTFKLFEACEKLDMPVIFHMGHTDGEYGLIDDLGLPRLEKALQTFPKLKFFGHSQRFWSHISGDVTEETRHGWPEGKVTEGGRIVELMRKYPNLNCDLSAGSGYNAVTRDPEFGYKFMEEFKDRVFYAADMCTMLNLKDRHSKFPEYLDNAYLNGKISEDAYYKISRGNAEKLLGI